MGRTLLDNSFLILLFHRGKNMGLLMTVGIVLLIPRLLGLAGGFIHLLRLLAIIVILVCVIQRRKPIP